MRCCWRPPRSCSSRSPGQQPDRRRTRRRRRRRAGCTRLRPLRRRSRPTWRRRSGWPIRALPGTLLLVVGSALLLGHQQLWAPFWTDRPALLRRLALVLASRPCRPARVQSDFSGHFYPAPGLAFDPDYSGDARYRGGRRDRSGPGGRGAGPGALTAQRSGTYDVYLVERPTTIVTLAGNECLGERVRRAAPRCDGRKRRRPGADRRNWFPRWRATVNGQAAPTQPDGRWRHERRYPARPGSARARLRG